MITKNWKYKQIKVQNIKERGTKIFARGMETACRHGAESERKGPCHVREPATHGEGMRYIPQPCTGKT